MERDRFDDLVLGHLPAMHRLSIRLTGNLDDAEDLMQEAMYRAIRGRAGYRGDAAFGTWLTRIVINAFRDRVRRARETADLPEELVDHRRASPSEEASAGELGRRVARLVSALPPRQREVLVLVAYEGMSIGEAAGVLDVTAADVRANLYHARRQLRERLGDALTEQAR